MADFSPDTARLMRYWVSGPGAARIGWGTPGAFDRCLAALGEHIQSERVLKGLCANLYHDATGRWPGEKRGDKG
jgi:hypothetical protein